MNMKATRIYTLLALLLMAGGVTMQAQGIQAIVSAEELPGVFFDGQMRFVSSNEFIIGTGVRADTAKDHTYDYYLSLVDDEGNVISTTYLSSSNMHSPDNWHDTKMSQIERFRNGSLGLFLFKFFGDTTRLQKVTISEDLSLSYDDYDWESVDALKNREIYEHWIVNKDGSFFFAYPLDSLFTGGYMGIKILKFSDKGVVIRERVLEHVPRTSYDGPIFLPTPDSLGIRIIMTHPASPLTYDCHTLDADLNTIAVVENIDRISYPFLCGQDACFRLNPYNGRTYSINQQTEMIPNPNDPHGYPPIIIHNQDVFMGMFDAESFDQLAYTWGITSPSPSTDGFDVSIDFDSEGGVYMVSGMDKIGFLSESLYIVHLDEDLNKLDEIYYKEDNTQIIYSGGMCVSPHGDVLIRCQINKPSMTEPLSVVYKVPASAFDGIDEAHDAGFAVAVAYPNPGKDVLNIRTGLKDARVEVYDMNGRLVHRQDITENVTGIDAGGWAEGVYVWKVMVNGFEAERGKWIKE